MVLSVKPTVISDLITFEAAASSSKAAERSSPRSLRWVEGCSYPCIYNFVVVSLPREHRTAIESGYRSRTQSFSRLVVLPGGLLGHEHGTVAI